MWRHFAATRSFMRSSDMLKRMRVGLDAAVPFPVTQACRAFPWRSSWKKNNAILVETDVETILPAAKLCIDA